MSIRVRPCADFEEYSHAVLGVGQYFGMERDDERLERFSRNLPLERMHAAFEDGRDVSHRSRSLVPRDLLRYAAAMFRAPRRAWWSLSMRGGSVR